MFVVCLEIILLVLLLLFEYVFNVVFVVVVLLLLFVVYVLLLFDYLNCAYCLFFCVLDLFIQSAFCLLAEVRV